MYIHSGIYLFNHFKNDDYYKDIMIVSVFFIHVFVNYYIQVDFKKLDSVKHDFSSIILSINGRIEVRCLPSDYTKKSFLLSLLVFQDSSMPFFFRFFLIIFIHL